jgi:hypothetical protein
MHLAAAAVALRRFDRLHWFDGHTLRQACFLQMPELRKADGIIAHQRVLFTLAANTCSRVVVNILLRRCAADVQHVIQRAMGLQSTDAERVAFAASQ